MKKLVYLFVCALAVLTLVNCNNNRKARSASVAAREYADHLRTRDYDRFINAVIILDDDPYADLSEQKATYARTIRRHVEPKYQQNGGVKNIDVVREDMDRDGKNATVVLRHNYNNGLYDDVSYDMALVDGDWKIKTGPNKEVWRTELRDGTPVSFKLKDTEHKDFIKERIGDERDFIKVKDYDNKEVLKVKDDGDREVWKVKEKRNETVIKHKEDGEKEVTRIPND